MVISIILAVAGLLVGGVCGYFGVNAAMRAKVTRKLKEAEDQGDHDRPILRKDRGGNRRKPVRNHKRTPIQ